MDEKCDQNCKSCNLGNSESTKKKTDFLSDP